MTQRKNKSNTAINKAVEEVKVQLSGESETMEKIFNLNNKQTFSKETKPKEKNGLALWGTKH